MRLEEYLESAKNEYQNIKPRDELKFYGWLKLKEKIQDQTGLKPALAIGFALSLLIISLVGLVQVAKASLPGETLYPIKRAVEEVTAVVTGDNQLKVEERGKEIIGLTAREEESKEKLDETVKEYREAINEARSEARGDEQQELESRLKEHREKFEVIYEETHSKEEIKKAIEATEENKGNEGVRGIKTEKNEGKGPKNKVE